jgi:hypothetical protein
MSSSVSPARMRAHASRNLALGSSRAWPVPLSSANDGLKGGAVLENATSEFE